MRTLGRDTEDADIEEWPYRTAREPLNSHSFVCDNKLREREILLKRES